MSNRIARHSNLVTKVLLYLSLSVAGSMTSAQTLTPQTITIAPINGPFVVGQVVQLKVNYAGSFIKPTWGYFQSSIGIDYRNYCTFTVDPITNIATVSLNHYGPCTIVAQQAGNAFYAASPVTFVPVTNNGTTSSVIAIKGAKTEITIPNLPTDITINAVTAILQTVVSYKSGAAQDLTPIANASNLVSVVSTTPDICAILGSTKNFTVKGLVSGACRIRATYNSNPLGADYAISENEFSINVSLQPQTINFPALGAAVTNHTLPLAASSSLGAGYPVTFSALPANVCSVSGTTLILSNPGSCTVKASQAGDSTYAPASAQQVLTVTGPGQTTTTVSSSANPATSVTLNATVVSAVPGYTPSGTVSFLSDGQPIAACNAVSLLNNATATCNTSALPPGTRSIVVNYLGDSNNQPSQSLPLSQTILPVPTISFTNQVGPLNIGSVAVVAATSTNAVTPVTISSLTPTACLVTSSILNNVTTYSVTARAATPVCVVAANQIGGNGFGAAVQKTMTISVNRAAQSISFSALPVTPVSAGSIGLGAPVATASSGLPLSFAVTNATPANNCVINAANTAVSFTKPGNCAITASQAGDGDFAPATSVTQNLTITTETTTTISTSGNPASNPVLTATVTPLVAGPAPVGTISFYVDNALTAICTVNVATPTCSANGLSAGTHQIKATYNGDSFNRASTSSNLSQLIVGTPTLNFVGPLPSLVVGGSATIAASSSNPATPVTIKSNTPAVCTITSASVNNVVVYTVNAIALTSAQVLCQIQADQLAD
ncbi:MAG: hypothetical protein RL748_1989, partial [Pseudomonadota bacterium]